MELNDWPLSHQALFAAPSRGAWDKQCYWRKKRCPKALLRPTWTGGDICVLEDERAMQTVIIAKGELDTLIQFAGTQDAKRSFPDDHSWVIQKSLRYADIIGMRKSRTLFEDFTKMPLLEAASGALGQDPYECWAAAPSTETEGRETLAAIARRFNATVEETMLPCGLFLDLHLNHEVTGTKLWLHQGDGWLFLCQLSLHQLCWGLDAFPLSSMIGRRFWKFCRVQPHSDDLIRGEDGTLRRDLESGVFMVCEEPRGLNEAIELLRG